MIPPFDHNNVLPPYLGENITDPFTMSPYPSDIMELCRVFATTPRRVAILKGLVRFRLRCTEQGISGRQWIDGDFVENLEAEGQEPQHVVAVSLIYKLADDHNRRVLRDFPEFADPRLSRQNYLVDHQMFIINLSPEYTVLWSKYWNLLFGHNRRGVWKGMLEIPLYDNSAYDQMALNYLDNL